MLLLLMACNPCFSQYFMETPIGAGATLRFPGEIQENHTDRHIVVTCKFSDYQFMGMTAKEERYNKDSSDAYYATFVKDFASNDKITNVHAKDFTYNGMAGKDINYDIKGGKFGRTRVLITRRTLYVCTVTSAEPDLAKSKVADAFFDSFKLE